MEKFLGKVIGEFVCDRIDAIRKRGIDDNFDYCYLSLDEWGNDDIEPEITAVKNSCVLRDDLNDYGKNNNILKGDEKLSGDDVREGLTAVISVKLTNPQFEGQTKTKLGNSEMRTVVAKAMAEGLGSYLEEHPKEAKD